MPCIVLQPRTNTLPMPTKGVYCLEGDWWGNPNNPSSVEPVLALLRSAPKPDRVPYVHKNAETVPALEGFLNQWVQKKYAPYPILYLAFHGAPGVLHVGKGKKGVVDVRWLGERLEGACTKRVIYFASCSTLGSDREDWYEFLDRTGAAAVCGYKKPVEWLKSTLFDGLALHELQDNAFTRAGAYAAYTRIKHLTRRLQLNLTFQMLTKPA